MCVVSRFWLFVCCDLLLVWVVRLGGLARVFLVFLVVDVFLALVSLLPCCLRRVCSLGVELEGFHGPDPVPRAKQFLGKPSCKESATTSPHIQAGFFSRTPRERHFKMKFGGSPSTTRPITFYWPRQAHAGTRMAASCRIAYLRCLSLNSWHRLRSGESVRTSRSR